MTKAAIGSKNRRICIHINNISVDGAKKVLFYTDSPYWWVKYQWCGCIAYSGSSSEVVEWVWTGRPAIPIFAGGEQAGRFTTALLEVRFLLQKRSIIDRKRSKSYIFAHFFTCNYRAITLYNQSLASKIKRTNGEVTPRGWGLMFSLFIRTKKT